MRMSDEEIRFWDSVDKLPNFMEQDEWDTLRADYHERKHIEMLNEIQEEKNRIDDICKRLEVNDYVNIRSTNEVPKQILMFSDLKVTEDKRYIFTSNKWGVELYEMDILFKYEKEAKERAIYYEMNNHDYDERYEQWLEYKESISNHKDPETVSQNMDELKADMIKLLEDNYWEMGYNGEWIRKDWDYNQTGSFTLEEAYKMEMSYQNDLDKAKNQKPDDLIMKFKND